MLNTNLVVGDPLELDQALVVVPVVSRPVVLLQHRHLHNEQTKQDDEREPTATDTNNGLRVV